MLKSFLILAALLLPINGIAQVLDFQIVSAGKSITYRSTTFQRELENRNGFSAAEKTVLLMETPSFQDIRYLRQQEILRSFGTEAEHLQIVSINSCTTEEDAGGYHTSLEEAGRLNPLQEFRATLLSLNGLVLYQSLGPLSKEKIRGIIQKARNSN
ncbi:MAG: hypothetical protein KKG47_15235 [Proteobacteria bacterium]|nr:hypothetical protein [Pseudomonadota bacterium]MBU1737442.1 hypothetical protein [Pseudomonadota bacterium]